MNRLLQCLLMSILLVAGLVHADTIKLVDGRVYEGRIVQQDNQSIVIDTMADGYPARLQFPTSQIREFNGQAVPDEFFEPVEGSGVDPDEDAEAGNANTYIYLPIEGTVGREILAQGIEQTLTYAVRRGVGHIVFYIDSTGGEMEEASLIAKQLEKFSTELTYHCIVKRAEGMAMVLPSWSPSVYLLPGATMGGITLDDEMAMELAGADVAMLAARAGARVANYGVPGEVMVAMMMQESAFCAWHGEGDLIYIDTQLPENTPTQQVIVSVTPENRLVLSRDQAVALNFGQAYEGDTQGLGEVLGIEGWSEQSDHGVNAMRRAVSARDQWTRRADAIQARTQRDIERNISKHAETVDFILACLIDFNEVDPHKGEYATYQVTDRNRRRGRYNRYSYYDNDATVRDTHRFTRDSRDTWRARTDRSIGDLRNVHRGVRLLNTLDREAERLGIVRDTQEILTQRCSAAAGRELQVSPEDLYRWTSQTLERLASERNRSGR